MVERLLLHIGTHKTGSSSIQASVDGYDDGTLFYARFNMPNHSDAMYTAFAEAPESYAIWRRHGLTRAQVQDKRRAYRDRFEQDLAREDRAALVVSGESMSRIDPAGKAELIDFARRHLGEIEVLCYVRAPVSFAASAFQERVKSGIKNVQASISPGYRNCLETYDELLGTGRVRVRVFDRRHLEGGSVVRDFCTQAGMDPDRVTETSRNESLSASALKILYTFNRTNPCFYGEKSLVRARRQLISSLQSLYAGTGAVDPARFVRHADHSDLDYLRSAHGIVFDDPGLPDNALDLESWLDDFSDVDLARLADLVEAPRRHAGDVAWLASRLYYRHLCEAV